MSNYKVVVLDDELFFRKFVIKTLTTEAQALSIEVVGEAANGEDGLALIKATSPDLVLVDINMPFMDGLALIQEVRRLEMNCSFIIISGYAEFEYARRALTFGVLNYLLKPIKKEHLLDCVRDVLPNQETSDEFAAVTNQVILFIDKNLSNRELTVQSIAEQLHFNYSYLCTIFKRDTDLSVNEYIVKKRMNKAKSLFQQGSCNIGLVAQQLGFVDCSYFSKIFKRTNGVTPTEYIRTLSVQ